jgi:hypothetical protein
MFGWVRRIGLVSIASRGLESGSLSVIVLEFQKEE